MNTYTAQQVTELLQHDDPEMNVRTVRYYSQIGIVPPLVTVGNKRVYTDEHLHYYRAVMTLSKTGETLASIQDMLKDLPMDEIIRIGNKLSMVQNQVFLRNETHQVSDDVFITLSPRISAELQEKVIQTVSKLIKEEKIR